MSFEALSDKIIVSILGNRVFNEESPCTIEQGCWVTPSGGDSKDSATERYRQALNKLQDYSNSCNLLSAW